MPTILSLIAAPGSGALTPARLAAIAAELARLIPSIPAPRILAPNEAAEVLCPTAPDPAHLAHHLASHLADAPIDIALTPATNRRKRLLIADMDSTIVTGETLDELAAHAGVGNQVAEITRRSMAGELDFAAALRARVALLENLPLHALEHTWAGVRLTPGARTLVQTMRAHGAHTALVSGGFTWFTARVAALCGFHTHQANILLDNGTTLLGQVAEPILDRDAKLTIMQRLAATHRLTQADCLAVGDGANDLAMIEAAGLGVAYRAKPILVAKADVALRHTDLRALLYLQGIAAAEFRD